MSRRYFLLTAFGKDRPGIVAGVSRVLYELGANMEDASMTRLGGEFTMMLIISTPAVVSAAKLDKSLRSLKKKLKLTIVAKPIPSAEGSRAHSVPARFLISVYGADR